MRNYVLRAMFFFFFLCLINSSTSYRQFFMPIVIDTYTNVCTKKFYNNRIMGISWDYGNPSNANHDSTYGDA